MRRHCAWLSCVLVAVTCQAAEIVAWKVPLSNYVPAGLEAQGVVRMKSAPEPSPFFKEGDEIWDLKGIPATDRNEENLPRLESAHGITTDPPLEWVVWNASTERLVTKADWNAIFQLHQQFRIDQMPKQVRFTAEVFEVPPNGAAPSEKSMPSAALTWVTRLGQEFSVTSAVDSAGIAVDGGSTFEKSLIDLNLHVSCSMPNQPRLDFHCAFVLRSGTTCWIARDFSGTTGLDCRISGRIELVNGTPLDEAVLIQKSHSFEPLKRDFSEPMRHRIGAKNWLMTCSFDSDNLADWQNSDTDPGKDADPFADIPPDAIRKSLKLQEVRVPDCLKAWFPSPVWDMREQIKRAGIMVKDSDFAGYAPFSQRIFFYTDDQVELDKFEILFTPMCIRSPKQIAASLAGNGETRLIARSGCKGEMTRTANNGVIRSFKIEPTIGETGELVDLRLEYLDQPDSVHKLTITSCLTLPTGKTAEIMSVAAHEADAKSLRLKAEILEVSR